MDLTERQLSRETIYEGKILHIYRDDVLLPNLSLIHISEPTRRS